MADNKPTPVPQYELKLTGITFYETPRIPGLRPGALSSINCEEPHQSLIGWRVVVRGQIVAFVSPPGWSISNRDRPHVRDPKGPMYLYEVPRTTVCLEWLGDEAAIDVISKGGRFEALLGPRTPIPVADDKPILSQIPAGQMGDA